ncbi:MAG: hypothetical protein RMA76_26755 [Deltaproteobacteria bacterium]|jgi:hypothetical protein
MKALVRRRQDELPKALRVRMPFVVEREFAPPPVLPEILRKAAYALSGAFVTGLVLLMTSPLRYGRYGSILLMVGAGCVGLGFVARSLRALPRVAVGSARAWERDYLTLEAKPIASLLGEDEYVLDYCAVSGDRAGRFGRTRIYMLTSFRVLEIGGTGRRLRVTQSLALRGLRSVEVDRARTGILTLEAVESQRDVTLAFPSLTEAYLARDAIREARRNVPVAEPGALAVVEAEGVGALALADASGLALSEEDT